MGVIVIPATPLVAAERAFLATLPPNTATAYATALAHHRAHDPAAWALPPAAWGAHYRATELAFVVALGVRFTAASVRARASACRAFAVHTGAAPGNWSVRLPTTGAHARTAPATEADARAMVAACFDQQRQLEADPNRRLRPIGVYPRLAAAAVVLCHHAGATASEAIGARVEDLHAYGAILIGTGSATRDVLLDAYAMDVLDRYRRTDRATRAPDPHTGALLVGKKHGRPITRAWVFTLVGTAAAWAGLPHVSPTALRLGRLIEYRRAGVPAETIMGAMGYGSRSSVYRAAGGASS